MIEKTIEFTCDPLLLDVLFNFVIEKHNLICKKNGNKLTFLVENQDSLKVYLKDFLFLYKNLIKDIDE